MANGCESFSRRNLFNTQNFLGGSFHDAFIEGGAVRSRSGSTFDIKDSLNNIEEVPYTGPIIQK
jgi:hypothetical protein